MFFLSLKTKSAPVPNGTRPKFVYINKVVMDNNSVKKNISSKRKESGISQSEMADRLGLSRTAYRNIEKGDTKLISEKVGDIAGLLKVTPEELVLGYRPLESASRKVEDLESEYEEEKTRIILEYETDIRRMQDNIRALNACIDALRDTIRTKDEMISMLKKKLSEYEKDSI